MSLRLSNLVKLNNVDLTDESRQPLEEARDERSVIIDLASGKKRKFIKGIKKKWTINWENVGQDSSTTIDGKGARNEIRAIAQLGVTMTFVLQDGHNSNETYTVFVTDYSEQTIMRRPNNGHRYVISMAIEEQG